MDNLLQNDNILNYPEAKWDVSGLFNFEQQFINLIEAGKNIFNCTLPIESIHGCYPLMWNNGRITNIDINGDINFGPEPILLNWANLNIGCYLTFSNHLIKEKEINDPSCNFLLNKLSEHNIRNLNGVIISSDILSKYIRKKYPNLKQKASIVKISVEKPNKRSFEYYNKLSKIFDIVMIHPDDNFNKPLIEKLSKNANKYEILINENCVKNCKVRHLHYKVIGEHSLKNWEGLFHFYNYTGEFEVGDIRCGRINYFNQDPKFRTNKRTCNLTYEELNDLYKMGFRHFKLQGRSDTWTYICFDFIRYAIKESIGSLWFKS